MRVQRIMSKRKGKQKKAIVLFSGGLDSTTLLYYAKTNGYDVECLVFDYGQRHKKEIEVARKIARHAKVKVRVVCFSLPWLGSSLLDKTKKVPEHKNINPKVIPSTYVPARNLIFLSLAASFAEAVGATHIFIGANAIDYSGYPDCRPEFFKGLQNVFKKGLKSGVEGKGLKIHAPFVQKTKAQIIRVGLKLDVPYAKTWSCYQGKMNACGVCDSCRLRSKGFEELGLKDPIE